MSKINLKTTNTKALPYNLSNDYLEIKVEIKLNYNPYYKENIPVTVYANFGTNTTTIELGTQYTDIFGIVKFRYNTNLIVDKTIQTALVWAKININGVDIYSNKSITNYIYNNVIDLKFDIIDANTPDGRLNHPNDYNIYNANTPASRLSDPDDYTIIHRSVN